MTFCDQLKVRLTGLEEHFDLPYADILEMPIFGSLKYRFQSNVNNYRHFLL